MAPATTTAMPPAGEHPLALALRGVVGRPSAARQSAPARRSPRTRLRGLAVPESRHGNGSGRRHRRQWRRRSAACGAGARRRVARGRWRRPGARQAAAARGGGGARSGGSGAGCATPRGGIAAAGGRSRPSARRRRGHGGQRRGRARRNGRARHGAGRRDAALVEHHAFDGAVGLVVRAAGDLRDGQPQLFEIDGVVDGPLHLERREPRAQQLQALGSGREDALERHGGAGSSAEQVEAGAVDGALAGDQDVVGVLAQQQQRITFAGDAVELEHPANGTRNGLESL